MMSNSSWLLLKVLSEQTMQERLLASQRLSLAGHEPRERRNGVKRALASTVVRLGLRLDPAAGEGLGASDLPLARPGGRR